jgi:hypothetical protein
MFTDNPIVWIILIIVVGLVVGYALWKGRGLKIRKDKNGISIETEGEKPGMQNISVGKNLKIKNSTVGDIAGKKIEGVDASPDSKENIDVLNGGTIERSQVGDIIGSENKNKSSKRKK